MPTITEGSLTFSFGSSWTVEKYDASAFYVNHFQGLAHSKGVDIVAIDSAGQVWLIEVKDYRANPRLKSIAVFEEVATKVRDTLAGLFVVQRRNGDALQHLAQRIKSTSEFRIALHLEQPKKHSKLYPVIVERVNAKLKLKQAVRAVDPHPIFCEKGAMPTSCGWTVA